MHRKSFLYRNIIVSILSIWALIMPIVGNATDVGTKDELVAAIGRGDSYIKFTTKIDIGNTTLTINSGTITLDLNEQELSMVNTNDVAAKAIQVNGGNLTIVGNGTVSVTSKKGKDGVWNSRPGQNGQDAYAIDLQGGALILKEVKLLTTPGSGGSGYSLTGLGKVDGKTGNSYPLKVKGIVDNNIAKGYNVKKDGEAISNYDVNELSKLEGSSSVSVELVNYKLNYNLVGGTNPASVLASYTIETKELSLPNPIKEGYNFDAWYYDEGQKADQASLLQRATSNPYERNLTAHWIPIKYAITYNLDEGANSSENPTDYTIESAVTLKDPSRDGYQFMGWYDNPSFSGNKITTIAKGSIDAKVFYAKWSKIYAIQYNPGEGIDLPADSKKTFIEEEAFDLPKLTPPDKSYTFMGWCAKSDHSDTPIHSLPKGTTGNKVYYAKWNRTYYITYHWQVPDDKETMKPMDNEEVSYTKDDAVTLLTPNNGAYKVGNWYDNAKLEGNPVSPVISKGTEKNFEFYAKWEPIEYSIKLEPYYGTFPDGTKIPVSYTYESEDIDLPSPVRSGYTFAGWFVDMALTLPASLPAKSMGNKTFYAKWTLGDVISIVKSVNGKIQVKSGNTEIKNNDKVGVGVALRITATPDSSIYKLTKLKIGDKIFTSSPVDAVMPASGGLTISAEFVDARPVLSAPKIITNPTVTDYIPAGENVTVTLENTDNTSTLYYSLDGAAPKLYSQPFQVSSLAAEKTIQVKAYAKKGGCKDGVSTRDIVFGKGKVSITFNLPKGITAVNPEGGEVVSAVASGGIFEFKLVVDRNYFESLDTLVVSVGEKALEPNQAGIYTLLNNTSNVVIKVTGITGVTHKIILSQTANGHIYFTSDEDTGSSQTVNHGDRVSVTAKPDEGYRFFAWKDGAIDNPRSVTVESDTTLQARFVEEDPGFMMVLPVLDGAKVKPLTGYPMQVKKGGTFKFYISKEADYSESVPEVFVNGEKLTVYKDVYSIYNVSQNSVIAVSGIKINETKLNLPEGVTGVNMETGKEIKEGGLTPVSMLMIRANAPEGKRFSIWNDGKADNPRIIAAKDAVQLLPLFISASDEEVVKVELPVLAGAGVGAVNANVDAIKKGGDIQLKLVLLPQFSQSDVKVVVNGKEARTGLSLRASSETKTLFYDLKGVTEDMKVEVSGLKLNTYTVSLDQSEGGSIRSSQSGVIQHGTEITLSATPVAGKMFMKWNNGNTLNPYKYIVTGDCVLSAQFIYSDLPVGNETIEVSSDHVYAIRDILHIESAKIAELYIWNFGGTLIKKMTVPNGHSTFQLSAGAYLIKVGDNEVRKIIVR